MSYKTTHVKCQVLETLPRAKNKVLQLLCKSDKLSSGLLCLVIESFSREVCFTVWMERRSFDPADRRLSVKTLVFSSIFFERLDSLPTEDSTAGLVTAEPMVNSMCVGLL